MKFTTTLAFLFVFAIANAQVDLTNAVPPPDPKAIMVQQKLPDVSVSEEIIIDRTERWKMNGNRYLTGGLVFLAGAAKGFNEALQYQYNGFESFFPKANDQWYYPAFSFKNKYKDGDPQKGAKFPLSTSVLVMFTDQYHLNNFIQRSSLTAALVLKIGQGKKPLRHYLFDVLYYTVCYQVGFHAVYTPIRLRNGN